MPTFAGRVTCMAPNSVDPSILAFGSGDGLIKVWKTASSKSMFEYTTTWQKGFRGDIKNFQYPQLLRLTMLKPKATATPGPIFIF